MAPCKVAIATFNRTGKPCFVFAPRGAGLTYLDRSDMMFSLLAKNLVVSNPGVVLRH